MFVLVTTKLLTIFLTIVTGNAPKITKSQNFRFDNMPVNDFGSGNNMYYSWDYSFVHFVAFSTEAYFTIPLDLGNAQNCVTIK